MFFVLKPIWIVDLLQFQNMLMIFFYYKYIYLV